MLLFSTFVFDIVAQAVFIVVSIFIININIAGTTRITTLAGVQRRVRGRRGGIGALVLGRLADPNRALRLC